ncbi:MAG: hypothetical protein RL291_1126 [Pseudomonadota bacterium]
MMDTAFKARFAPGARVRVDDRPALGHCRSPHYLRGLEGRVVEVLGAYKNPEQLAYHKPGWPLLPLYKVRFAQSAVWGDYAGARGDELEADIFENWLLPVTDGK